MTAPSNPREALERAETAPADVTVEELARKVCDVHGVKYEVNWYGAKYLARALLDAYGMWRR